MSDYLRIPCPRCAGRLRIRAEYVGRQVACKQCGVSFTAQDQPPGPDFERENARLRSELDDARAAIEALTARVGTLAAERDGFEAEISQARHDLDATRRARDDLKCRCERERGEQEAAYEARCREADSELARLETGLSDIRVASDAAREAFATERSGWQDRLDRARIEAEELQGSLCQAREAHQAAAGRFEEAHRDVTRRLEEAAAQAARERADQDDRLREANDRAERAAAEAQRAGQDLARLTAELEEASREKLEVSAALDETKEFVSRMRSQLSSLGIYLPE